MATPPRLQPFFLVTVWAVVLFVFFALRIDTSSRTYFQIDDQIVVWAVDDAVNNNNWQPDWYRVGTQAAQQKGMKLEIVRDEPLHEHHYNFSGHMLLSAAIIKPLRLLGITTPTIVLLHHIAVFWDAISFLFVILAAHLIGGNITALCSAILYTVFPLTVQGSHYARPDALLTAMGSILFWLALKKNCWKNSVWLLANGLVLGTATAGKASQLMLGIFPAIACCLPLLRAENRNIKTFTTIVLQGLALLVLVFAVLQLMFFIGDMSVRDFWLSVRSVQLYYLHPKPPDILEHYSYIAQLTNIAAYFNATLGWPLLALGMTGIGALMTQKYIEVLLLIIIPFVFFILYFSSVPAFFDRSFCALSAPIVILISFGAIFLTKKVHLPTAISTLVILMACWKPIEIQYHLQTDHLRNHHNKDRLAFQQQLKQQWSKKYDKDFWIKNIDRKNLFAQILPEKLTGNPRIYVAEDLNDYNSRDYLEKLRSNSFVQIASFEGDFADMPTNSLITVHEAARFAYFVRSEDINATQRQSQPSK